MKSPDLLNLGIAQICPVWLNKQLTINKIMSFISEAGSEKCDLVVFGEGLLPGYPFWISLTDGAKFNSAVQKELYAHYMQNAIQIEAGDLDDICELARQKGIAIYLGAIERAKARGGHSLYCSLIFIDKDGVIKSVHRKLQPTYEERLTWAQGDGNGLQVHKINKFYAGGLNCWENWMPLARTALYGQGENLHIAVWPGADSITSDISRFIAKESRSFVVSVSGLMRKEDFPTDTPHIELILDKAPDILANGGSCIVAPDGEWTLEPVVNKEGLFIKTIDINRVYEERQNFDCCGHYSRSDITQLNLNRTRQSIINIED